jgi:hypothetical protein
MEATEGPEASPGFPIIPQKPERLQGITGDHEWTVRADTKPTSESGMLNIKIMKGFSLEAAN